MENKELQLLWKEVGMSIPERNKKELDIMLTAKSRRVIRNLNIQIIATGIICAAYLLFLVITLVKRPGDTLLLINDLIIGTATAVAFIMSVRTILKLRKRSYTLSLLELLHDRILILNHSLNNPYSMISWFILPILFVLTFFSVRVYMENKPFLEAFINEEDFWGLIFGFSIGLFVSFFTSVKIRKARRKDLEFIEDLYKRLSEDPV